MVNGEEKDAMFLKGYLETNDFSLFEQIISPNTRDAAFKTIEEKLGEFIYPLEKKEAEEKFQTRYAGFANEQGISFEKAVEEAKGFDNLDNYMQGLMMADHEEKKFSQPDEAKLWFDEFQTILEADGIDINNPYALGLVGVIDDLSNDEFDELEGKKTEMKQRAQTVVKPAFIKWDKNGKNVPFDGKNYAEYIHENTEQISSVSDEKINYLYEMSKAGRLVVEHKDSTVGSINYHVVYTKNGMAMQINAAEFASTKKKTNYQELGLTSQEFKTIADRRMNVQDVLKNTTDLVKEDCGKLFTEKGQKAAIEEYSKYIWSDGKSAICHAGKDHPEWFDTKEHRALTNDLTIAGIKTDPEKQGRFYTASEKQLLNSDIGNYTNDSTQTCIEKLIKKTGSKDINDLMTKSILDVSGKLITGNSIMEFQQKIGKEVHLGNPFYIKPFDAKVHQEKGFEAFKYSVIGHGLSESSGKESYTKQMDQILAELHKTDSVFSKDSDEYKQLMTAFDTLKQSDILSGVNQNDAMFENGLDNNLKESLQTLSDLGKRYQEAHNAQNQTKDLSTRQTSRLIAINKLIHLNECIQSGAKCPVLPEEQFASRIVMGKAQTMLDSKNPMIRNFGKNLLTNREAFNAEVSELKTHSFFKNLSARADTVERCFRIDMKKVYSSFEQSEKNYLDKVDMKKVSALKETSVSIKNGNQKDSEWTLLN